MDAGPLLRQTSPAPAADPGLSGSPDNLPLLRGPLPLARLTLDPSKPRSPFSLSLLLLPSSQTLTLPLPDAPPKLVSVPAPPPRARAGILPQVSSSSEPGYPSPSLLPMASRRCSPPSPLDPGIQAPSPHLQGFRSLDSQPPPPLPRTQPSRAPAAFSLGDRGIRAPGPSSSPSADSRLRGSRVGGKGLPGPTAAGCSPSSARLGRPTASPLPPRLRHPPPSSRLPPAPRPGSQTGTPRPSPLPRGPPPRPLPPPCPARPGFPLPRSWPRSRGKNSIQPGRRSGRGRALAGGRPGSVTQGGGKGQKGPGGSGPATLPPLPPSASLGRARLSRLRFSSLHLSSLPFSLPVSLPCFLSPSLSLSLPLPLPLSPLFSLPFSPYIPPLSIRVCSSLPASFPFLRVGLPTHHPLGNQR